MPTSLEQIQGFLDEFNLKYRVDEDRGAIVAGFAVDPEETTYRDADGDPGIQMVIGILEDGDALTIFVPQAWNLFACPHKAAVFESLAVIQSRFKFIRFDYDPEDGELRPNVELPVEDAELTSMQFHRLMHAIFRGVQRFDAVIRHAMTTGEVSFAMLTRPEPDAAPSPTVARLQQLAEEAGGIEALERLASGSGPDPAPDTLPD